MTPQELKNSILQLAIQGKLVEQRPEEGTAEELFSCIRHFSHGNKASKEELDYSSMDFDIPNSWIMLELNQVFNFIDYRGKTPNKIAEGVFLITASNIRQGYMDYSRKEYISEDEYNNRMSRGITQKGDLLFTTEAPMGYAAICDLERCSCGQRIITFQEYGPESVIPKLFMYFLLSPSFQQQLLANCTGTTAKGIKDEKLKHFKIPFPPRAEQKRIVAKIEELLPLIDRYEKAWSRLEEFNKRFPDDMQKSILQMAIQGKLVEQRPEEGTGEELYRQIQAEKQKLIKEGKIKKEKPFSTNTKYMEYPFEIPETWTFVRFGDLMICRDSERIPVSTEERSRREKAYDYYGASGIIDKIDDYLFDKDLLLIGEDGANLLNRSTPIAFIAKGKYWVNNHAHVLDTCAGVLIEYICYFINAISLAPYVTGTAQPKMNQENMNAIWVSLPPVKEQKRIVAALSSIIPLCSKLNKNSDV